MIKKILLAVDLGPFTANLLQHAADLSSRHQADLIIVHAIEPLGSLGHALLHAYLKPETTHEMTTTGLQVMVEEVKAQVIDILTDEHIDGETNLPRLNQVIVRTGSPAEVILQAVDDEAADVVVLGSHNMGMSAQLGTVAQKTLNNARVPVFLVPNIPFTHQSAHLQPPLHLR